LELVTFRRHRHDKATTEQIDERREGSYQKL